MIAELPTSDEPEIVLTPTLIRAARALLNFDQETLAQAANISRKTITLIETMTSEPTDPRRRRVLKDLRRILEQDLNVEFTFASETEGEGVRLTSPRRSEE